MRSRAGRSAPSQEAIASRSASRPTTGTAVIGHPPDVYDSRVPCFYGCPPPGGEPTVGGVNTRHLAILVATSFALAGCGSKAPDAAPPGPSRAAATTATTPAASPVVTGASAGDWCALVKKLSNQSGLMVGTHFISPLKETLDQFKVATTLYLANADALLDPGLPPDVRAAVQV